DRQDREGTHAMNEATSVSAAPPSPFAFDWFDPLEEAVRGQVRWFIEQLLEEELEAAPGRGPSNRGPSSNGRRHGHRPRQLVTTFGPLSLSVPRARLADQAGEQGGKSGLLPAYKGLRRRGGGRGWRMRRASRIGRARFCRPTSGSAAGPRR